MKYIYLDNAALTPVDPRVLREMAKVSKADIGNPSSIHHAGVAAKKIADAARARIAQALHAHADEIIFTGSGTEANNLAIFGVVEAYLAKNKDKTFSDVHIIVSAIEHASILEPVRQLEKKGVRAEYVPVTREGIIDVITFKKMLTPETLLVSVMMANNEIGTIQPISDIVKIVRDFKNTNKTAYPLVHTDASQAVLYTDINLEKIGVDMLTIDSHKVYGPRGVGVLFARRSVLLEKEIAPMVYGGGQEDGIRPGTENIPGIAGFAKAMEIAVAEREKEIARITKLRDYFFKGILKISPSAVVIGAYTPGDYQSRLVNNVNIHFPDTDHEFLLLKLDARGIMCSTKSSCLKDEDESYVLRALDPEEGGIRESLRFTLGRYTTKQDLDYTLKNIDEALNS
jgi:cysteine desulfurase